MLLISSTIAFAFASSSAVARDALSDPTRPPSILADVSEATEDAVDETLDLRAIFFAKGRRLAVINGQRLHEADEVGNARIIEILPDRVRLRRDSKTFELELVGRSVKVDAGTETEAPVQRRFPKNAFKTTARDSVEDWGGPSTMVPAPDGRANGSPSDDSPESHQVPAAYATDWDQQPVDQEGDSIAPSEHQTPGMLDALLGEGNDQ